MEAYSVIVTVHDMEGVIARTLRSVETAMENFREQDEEAKAVAGEIVVVDDGSTDATWSTLEKHAAENSCYRLVRHTEATSPSCARNAGVKASTGSLLFFLDGDDLFYRDHIAICQWAMQDQSACFVKTKVHLADPVRPEWAERINHSLVINLCVRRRCHDEIGGFLDYHLFVRRDAAFHREMDISYKLEDQYYNELITGAFHGVCVPRETVEYMRYRSHP